MASFDTSKHLSLIDSGISDLWSINLPSHLESLNLHGNLICSINNLSQLRRLTHLDLSANQIRNIEGLDHLTFLKTLNLSCNRIRKVEGLSRLRCLERLNLSYNELEDVHGISDLAYVNEGNLIFLALHGNNLYDINSLISGLKHCHGLQHLILVQDGSGNPLCSARGYEEEIKQSLPQLSTLNEMDRSGKVALPSESMSNIPGLESYLEYLLSSDGKDQSSSQAQDMRSSSKFLDTPKIDAVMAKFKEYYSREMESSSSFSPPHMVSSRSSPSTDTALHTESMKKILSDPPVSWNSPLRVKGSRRVKEGVYFSSEENEPVRDSYEATISSPHNAHSQSSQRPKSKSSAKRKESNTMAAQRSRSNQQRSPALRVPGATPQNRSSALRSDSEDTSSASFNKRTARKGGGGRSGGGGGGDGLGDRTSGDEKKRQEVETGYKDLLTTLESERERRWKAEQAVRKLAEVLKTNQAKHHSTEEMKTSALEATVQLKQAVLNEHEVNQKLSLEISKLKNELADTKEKLNEALRADCKNREALKEVESTFARKEGEEMAERVHQARKLQEAQQRASSQGREADILKHALDASKVKVEKLQETLASREQQHREEMRDRYSLNSPQLQEVITTKVRQAEKQHQAELVRQQERVEQLSKQYTDLENEFRQALVIEEKRFKELKAEMESATSERDECQQLLLTAQRKDETSTNIITELSALVKEQKGRISELAKAKHEMVVTYKERVEMLEESLEDARKQVNQLDMAKQTKSKLQATVQAQESVIEGLKAERRLWGQELAQQGASLAQDRGRLEAKIETFDSEISMLKKQLERETDSVKIKTKMVEDQTETIRKLKEAVLDRDETIKATREENLNVQRNLEDQISDMKTALDDSRDAMERALARKEELKMQVATLEEQLAESKASHSSLGAKWREKSELIGQLEQQVTQMRNNWSQKEVKMTAERDMALKQSKEAVEKLKSVDTLFRQQLDVKEAAFQSKLKQMETEKQQEIELANQKVAIVEEEMRDLLRDNEASKRAMEAKVKRLTQALGDLQTDLL